MTTFLLVTVLACSATDTADSTVAALSSSLSILSPDDGAELVQGESVWLEVAGIGPEGDEAEPADVRWTVHGTEWEALGNQVQVRDLPEGWALLLATAVVEGSEATDGVEIVVLEGDTRTGDTGTTQTADTGSAAGGIDHVLSLVYDPSPVFEAKGYSTCTASYSAELLPRTSGDLCPETDLTVDGALSVDAASCPAELLSSIPDPIAYGIDQGHSDGWDLWVPDSGNWYSIGVATDQGGGLYRLLTEQAVRSEGVNGGTVTWRFDFQP